MKKLLLATILLFAGFTTQAQEISKFVTSIGGEPIANASNSINFTIGEPLIGFVSNNGSVDQGFWAGSLQVEPITVEEDLDGIVIYPNPVEEELNIYAGANQIYGITLFAVNGQMTLKKKVDATLLEHRINTSHLAKGMYVLRLFTQEDKQEKLFKIIKK